MIGSAQKVGLSVIPHPQRKFPPSGEGEGNCFKNVLNLNKMSREGKEGIVNFLCGGYGSFLELPNTVCQLQQCLVTLILFVLHNFGMKKFEFKVFED